MPIETLTEQLRDEDGYSRDDHSHQHGHGCCGLDDSDLDPVEEAEPEDGCWGCDRVLPVSALGLCPGSCVRLYCGDCSGSHACAKEETVCLRHAWLLPHEVDGPCLACMEVAGHGPPARQTTMKTTILHRCSIHPECTRRDGHLSRCALPPPPPRDHAPAGVL